MHKKWNISILVIFILLASSLLGILSMNFVQQMMKQSAIVHSYYTTYYLSQAGIELGLTAIKTRGPWFDYIVNSWDAIIQDNLLSGYSYSLSLSISGTAPLLSKNFRQGSWCNNPYVLSGGDSLIIPLFRDATIGTLWTLFTTGIAYSNLAVLLDELDFLPSGTHGDVTYGILILSGSDLSQNGVFFQKWTLQWGLYDFTQAFEEYLQTISDPYLYWDEAYLGQRYQDQRLTEHGFRMYLMISNASDDGESFCVDIAQPKPPIMNKNSVLPTDVFFLQSQASYGNQTVVLDASYAQPIPGFLFSTYTSF